MPRHKKSKNISGNKEPEFDNLSSDFPESPRYRGWNGKKEIVDRPSDALNRLIDTASSLQAEEVVLLLACAEALRRPALPEKAPVLYADREDRSVDPAQFIYDTYREYMDVGLPRAHLRKIDPKLYEALSNWLRTNDLPDKVNLAKQVAKYDEIAELISSLSPNASSAVSKLYSMAQRLQLRILG